MNTGVLIEIFGFASGVIYLILEIKQKKLMWIVGIITALFYIYIFYTSSLFAQVLLQIYYLLVSLYGLREWRREQKVEVGIYYRRAPVKIWLYSLLSVLLLFFFITYILKQFTPDPMPASDAAATAISVLAMYWLSKSYIEQWLLWIVVNIITVVVCFSQQLYLTSLLYSIFAFSALYGYTHWAKKGHFIK